MPTSPLKADRKYKNVRLDLFTISAIHTGYSYDNIGPFAAHEQSPSWRDIINITLS